MQQLEEAELAPEVADRTRREVAAFRLFDRLRPAFGHTIGVTTLGGGPVMGTVQGVGPDWLLVAEQHGLEALIPLDAITGITGLGSMTAVPGSEGKVAEKLRLGHAVRGIARDRAGVAVSLRDAGIVTGTIDRVGADFFEMAEHAAGEARRRGQVVGVRSVPFTGVAFIRRS